VSAPAAGDAVRTQTPVTRPAWRRRAAAVVLVGALVLHGGLIVRGGSDPHKLFGFRPFNESDTWQAEIVRVDGDGVRRPVQDGTWAYDWDELVGARKLRSPWRHSHAPAGADAVVDLLDRALEWAIVRIPDDPETVALEATVSVVRNTRGPEVIVLRSPDRSLPGRTDP
jgi:hypothetical protein